MAGTLVLDTLQNGAGTYSTSADNVIRGCAKAWVYYKGTATVGIQGSFNVSSVTYNSVGVYTINITTALPNANYAVVTGISGFGSGGSIAIVDDPSVSTYSTTQFTVRSRANTGAASADDYIHAAVFSN